MSAVITPQRKIKVPKYPEEKAKSEKAEEPENNINWFSFRKLWAFTGPGFLMSIAYLDPGNIESDLQSGSNAQYDLLWVLLIAHIFGLLLQRLCARVSVVTGYDIAQTAQRYYHSLPKYFLWIMAEVAIIGSDMQEVIGTATAIYLLSNGWVPLWAGVLITICDTFTFMFLDRFGVRKFEFIFCFLISVMAATFGFEFYESAPKAADIFRGATLPWTMKGGTKEFLTAVSIIGAVIMPHNLYLHSSLVKSRNIDRTQKREISDANKYYFIESSITLFVSFIINLLVVVVFGKGFYSKTNADIVKIYYDTLLSSITLQHDSCMNDGNRMPLFYRDIFENNTDDVDINIYTGGVMLGCTYGVVALYIWAIGILAAGQSSTMTGTFAGQFVMEGFLNLKMAKWKRILISRTIAIFPTLLVAIFSHGIRSTSALSDFLNCLQIIQLPFALLPTLTFACDRRIMRDFACTLLNKIFCVILSVIVISVNLMFLISYISNIQKLLLSGVVECPEAFK
uniref:Nramp-domain-containing protein n=1 Tax=Syphacia muris TaxID=451379 RepID=A0A0N5ADF7_9BILA